MAKKNKPEAESHKTRVDGQPQKRPLLKRQAASLLALTAIIVVIPVILLVASQNITKVDYSTVLRELSDKIGDPNLAYNFVVAGAALSLQLFVIVMGVGLLFRIEDFNKNTMKALMHKKVWKYFLRHIMTDDDNKRVWHVYLGYFLILLAVTPALGENLVDLDKAAVVVTLQDGSKALVTDPELRNGIILFNAMIAAIPMLTVIILSTRILSRLNVKILDTNIGLFVLAIFLAESLFLVAAGRFPLSILEGMTESTITNVHGALEMYGYILVGAIFATILDIPIVDYLVPKLKKKIKSS